MAMVDPEDHIKEDCIVRLPNLIWWLQWFETSSSNCNLQPAKSMQSSQHVRRPWSDGNGTAPPDMSLGRPSVRNSHPPCGYFAFTFGSPPEDSKIRAQWSEEISQQNYTQQHTSDFQQWDLLAAVPRISHVVQEHLIFLPRWSKRERGFRKRPSSCKCRAWKQRTANHHRNQSRSLWVSPSILPPQNSNLKIRVLGGWKQLHYHKIF